MDYMFSAVASDGWTEEVLTIVGILSLILHHSTKEALAEASKTIILNVPLVSTINNIISEACSKGPALSDHDEGTRTGDVLIFVLLLLFFSLRSIRAILPGIIDFQILLDEGRNMQPLSYVSIRCHDLCKLMHFGSAPVKLIASFCLVELFNGISDYTSRTLVDLKLREGYLSSISAVLEGLIFFNDIRVALNCSLCFSSLTTWRELQVEPMILEKDHWCRLIVEELVMSLSTPSLTTKSLMIHHKPAANVAVALLKLSETPSWMTKVFDDSSIRNFPYPNPREEACRRQVYTDDNQDSSIEDHMQHVAVNLDHVGKTRTFLFSLVSSHSYPGCYLWRSQSRKKELLEEIELFTKCLMEEDEV
ncbi:protein putative RECOMBINATION INITIATION DEFECT 1 [Sesamum angolense]|uniref:Protein putative RECOMBINATION INITIATION DEFECT 1 n=1 Tax=Sesamum angolense TaxID=2727404 RepID=A0AAE1X3I5_9LAMI|nr:protein putative RECOMBINATION INITIATION DEFECT 1 [Sesamum angolense]